jgi:tetratricopeptide (TPR) repeat protein
MKSLCRLGGQRPHGIAILALGLCYCLAGNASTEPILQDSIPAQSQPATSQLQDELEQTLRLLQEERLVRTQTTMREHLTEADAQGPALAWSLNDAALLLAKEGKLEMAQAVFERALEIVETHFDSKHPARQPAIRPGSGHGRQYRHLECPD